MIRKYLQKTIHTLFFYNVDVFLMYIAISIVFLHQVTRFHINMQNFILIFIANILGVTAVYTLNKVTDKEEDRLNGHTLFHLNTTYIYPLIGIFFLCATGLYLLSEKPYFIFYGFVLFLLSVLYSFPKKYRLKNIFLIKNIVPALCWFFSLSLLIYGSTTDLSLTYIMGILTPLLVLEFIFEIIWDFPDYEGDKASNIKTLPVVIGFLYTKILLVTLITLYFFSTDAIPNKVMCLLFFIFILFISPETKKNVYHYFLSGITVSACVVYFLSI